MTKIKITEEEIIEDRDVACQLATALLGTMAELEFVGRDDTTAYDRAGVALARFKWRLAELRRQYEGEMNDE